jgi:pheromone shutdown protein TraB
LFLVLLLHARQWVMDVLGAGAVRTGFQKLFEFSDSLDAKYVQNQNKICGNAMWITPVIWIGITSAVALMFLLIMVTTSVG